MLANATTMRLPSRAPAAEDPDLPLVEGAKRGDHVAFEQLYSRYERPIARMVANIVRYPEVVPDLVQEIFAKVYFALDSFSPGMPFRPWLYRVAGNHCVDYLRKHRRQPAEVSTTALPGQDSDWILPDTRSSDNAKTLVSRDLAEKLLETLKPRDRMLLVMKEIEDLSLDEISAATGMGISAVKVALFRARRRMLDRYQKWFCSGEQ